MIHLFLFLIGLQFHCCHFTRPHDVQECKTREDVWPKIIPYNADFAFSLYKEMSSTQDDKNILLSPVSISIAFAMLSLGATSETQSQIYRGLGFNLSEIEENEIHKGFCQLIHQLNRPREEAHVKVGNALFFDESLEVQPTFLEDVRNLYHTEDFFIDFLNSTRAEEHINNYVNNKTYGKTVNAVKDLSEDTRMVLVNYVFFNNNWKVSFHRRLTFEGEFLAYGNTTVTLEMMSKHTTNNFFRDEVLSCSVVEVPYAEDVVAWFILPDNGKLKDLESSFVKEDLRKWKASSQITNMQLVIPKLFISASNDVKDLLQRLGVTNAFNDQAALSGITGKHNLRVSLALHEAVLVVHEDYAELSQALPGPVVVPRPGSSILIQKHRMFPSHLRHPPPPPRAAAPPYPLPMKFNRPFLMTMIDTSTETILLMAKIVNPTKE